MKSAKRQPLQSVSVLGKPWVGLRPLSWFFSHTTSLECDVIEFWQVLLRGAMWNTTGYRCLSKFSPWAGLYSRRRVLFSFSILFIFAATWLIIFWAWTLPPPRILRTERVTFFTSKAVTVNITVTVRNYNCAYQNRGLKTVDVLRRSKQWGIILSEKLIS